MEAAKLTELLERAVLAHEKLAAAMERYVDMEAEVYAQDGWVSIIARSDEDPAAQPAPITAEDIERMYQDIEKEDENG